jgi:hypothetical protein
VAKKKKKSILDDITGGLGDAADSVGNFVTDPKRMAVDVGQQLGLGMLGPAEGGYEAVARLLGAIPGVGSKGGGGKTAADPTQAPAGPQGNQPASNPSLFGYDPLSMQTFWTEAILPYLTQVQQQWGPMLEHYGQAMNQALGNPMPAAAKQVLQSYIPQFQAQQAALGESLSAQVPAQMQYNQLLGQLQSNQQAAQQAYQQALYAKTQGQLTQQAGVLGGVGTTPTTGQANPQAAAATNAIVQQLLTQPPPTTPQKVGP